MYISDRYPQWVYSSVRTDQHEAEQPHDVTCVCVKEVCVRVCMCVCGYKTGGCRAGRQGRGVEWGG